MLVTCPDVDELVKQGKYSEALGLLEGNEDELSRVTYSLILEKQGKYQQSFDVAKEVYDSTDSFLFKLRSLVNMAYAARFIDKQPLQYIEEAFSILPDSYTGIERWVSELYYLRGIVMSSQSLDQSIADFAQSLSLREQLGNQVLISHSLNALGVVHDMLGMYDKSLEYHNKALSLKEDIGSPQDIYRSLVNIGQIYRILGDYETSIPILERALNLGQGIGNVRDLISLNSALGACFRDSNLIAKATKKLEHALALAEVHSFYDLMVSVSYDLLRCWIIAGDKVRTKEVFEHIEELHRTKLSSSPSHLVIISRALYHKSLGRLRWKSLAIDELKEAVDQFSLSSDVEVFVRMNILQILIEELSMYGDSESLAEIQEQLNRLESSILSQGSQIEKAKFLVFKGEVELFLGKIDSCISCFDEAYAIAEKMKYDRVLDLINSSREKVDESIILLSMRARALRIDIKSSFHNVAYGTIQVPSSEDEPILLMLMEKGGVLRYSHHFMEFDANEHLVGSFLSAFNVFANEVALSRGKIQTFNFGRYSVVLLSMDKRLLAYIYDGNSESATKKLIEFSVRISQVINQPEMNASIVDSSTSLKLDDIAVSIF